MKLVNKSKRVLAMLVCALLVVLSVVPTMADTQKTSNLTINNAQKGHTYKVYQLLKGNVSELSNGSGKLSNVELGKNVKSGITKDEIITALTKSGLSEVAIGNLAYSYIDLEDTSKTLAATITKDNSTATIEDGYYVVVDTWTDENAVHNEVLSRALVAVVGDTTMQPKISDAPEIDKNIIDTDANKALEGDNASSKKTDTAAIGDTIEYEVTGKVPNMEAYTYYYYYITDTLSDGLTLVDKFTVKIGDTTLTRDSDYYVYTNGQTFELAIKNLKSYTMDAKISIKYNAIVNEHAVIGIDPNTNTVHLNYSNNPNKSKESDENGKPGIPDKTHPTGQGPDKITNTYITKLTIKKVDQNGQILTGAEFTLTGDHLNKIIVTTGIVYEEDAAGSYYKLKDGSYTTDDPATHDQNDYESVSKKYTQKTVTKTIMESGETSTSVKAFVGDNGELTFEGLNAGTYTLTESVTPKGYNTMSDLTFAINASCEASKDPASVGGKVTWSSTNNQIELDTTNNVFKTTIKNTQGNTLPSTGGIGTRIFYIIGGLLMAAAAVVLITKVRFNKNK